MQIPHGWAKAMIAQDVPDLSTKHLRAVVALARFGSFIGTASLWCELFDAANRQATGTAGKC
jgi:hypothetical protein